MIDDDFEAAAYVAAAAPSIGLKLPPQRMAEIAAAFALVVRMARPALECELPENVQAAPIFMP
jgi:hypothetical protein